MQVVRAAVAWTFRWWLVCYFSGDAFGTMTRQLVKLSEWLRERSRYGEHRCLLEAYLQPDGGRVSGW